jgi:hypothetical protein
MFQTIECLPYTDTSSQGVFYNITFISYSLRPYENNIFVNNGRLIIGQDIYCDSSLVFNDPESDCKIVDITPANSIISG